MAKAFIQQAPSWLPYRIRTRVDQYRIVRALRGLHDTRPYPAADPTRADAEVHILIGRRDVMIGVLALKSILRFAEDRLAVTLTDDGSLQRSDRAWIARHIPNTRWLDWPLNNEQIERGLAGRPTLAALYHSDFQMCAKLVHPVLLSRCEHVIQMDTDTAFFRRPQRVFDWMQAASAGPLYLHDHQDEADTVPQKVHAVFTETLERLAGPGRAWSVQHRFFNAGLLAYRPQVLDLDVAERYLAWQADAPDELKTGRPEIWFGPWTAEQTSYHVMFGLGREPAEPLGSAYHIGGASGHVFNHFLRHYLVRREALDLLAGLIDQL